MFAKVRERARAVPAVFDDRKTMKRSKEKREDESVPRETHELSIGDVPQSTQTNCSSFVLTTGALQEMHFSLEFRASRG